MSPDLDVIFRCLPFSKGKQLLSKNIQKVAMVVVMVMRVSIKDQWTIKDRRNFHCNFILGLASVCDFPSDVLIRL